MKERQNLFRQVIDCQACPSGTPKLLRDRHFNLPQPGYVGSNFEATGVLLISQNPGVSPPRARAQDKRYAALLNAFGKSSTLRDFDNLSDFLRDFIVTWPIHGNYFPLVECGLALDDIAYFNLVRCRTRENSPPSVGMRENCVENHLKAWLEMLRPNVIVSIGKWAFDNLPDDVTRKYGTRIGVINRQRSLPGTERQANRREVVDLVISKMGAIRR